MSIVRNNKLTQERQEKMYKKILVITALVAVIGALVFGAVYTAQAKFGNDNAGRSGSGSQQGTGSAAGGTANLPPATPGDLSAEEAAALLYMREEEKLAHDVYVALYAKWGLPVFQNISQSEQTHSDAIKVLIDRYGLTDPATGETGTFTNPELQALYDELVARGSQSLAEAIKVGAAIEEIDILDLEARIAQTDNADIQQVFASLKSGSYNHLRAFSSTLTAQTDETYVPQYLSPDAYQAIISGTNGNGNRGGGNGQGGNRGGGSQGGRP
jgi:hypothetical protein